MIFDDLIIPICDVSHICVNTEVNGENIELFITNILKHDYMAFDKSLKCFPYYDCLIFVNLDKFKSFIFQKYQCIVEDKSVINFLIYCLNSNNIHIFFKYFGEYNNMILKDKSVLYYIEKLIEKNKVYGLKFNFKIDDNYFKICVFHEDDIDVIIDPRYFVLL